MQATTALHLRIQRAYYEPTPAIRWTWHMEDGRGRVIYVSTQTYASIRTAKTAGIRAARYTAAALAPGGGGIEITA